MEVNELIGLLKQIANTHPDESIDVYISIDYNEKPLERVETSLRMGRPPRIILGS